MGYNEYIHNGYNNSFKRMNAMPEYANVTNSKVSFFNGDYRNYMTVAGYTKRSGCPTNFMVQIQGSNRWYRVMNYCTSNSGTLFIKTKDNSFLVVRSEDTGYGKKQTN